MSTQFPIQSSDALLLERATQVAHAFARQYIRDDVAGIVFLGGIARDYFDHAADIDIGLFTEPLARDALSFCGDARLDAWSLVRVSQRANRWFRGGYGA